MFDSRQVSLLAEMGIPVWLLRSVEEGTAPTIVEHDVVDNDALLTRMSDARWLVCHDGEDSPQAQRLLQAMLSTIAVSYQDMCVLTLADVAALTASAAVDLTGKTLLLFGDRAVQQHFGVGASVSQYRNETHFISQIALTTVVSFGLNELLQNSNHKVLAWHDLQLAKSVQQPD